MYVDTKQQTKGKGYPKEDSSVRPLLRDIYKVLKGRYSYLLPYNQTFKVLGRRIRLRTAFILIAVLLIVIIASIFLRLGLREFRFAPQQFLGYRYCTSSANKVNLHNFDHLYPCDFSTPIPSKDGVTVVTFVNSGWINMTKNWVCSAKKVGLTDNILLITVEPNVCSHFPDVPCHYEKGSSISITEFGKPNYQMFMIERTKITLRLLSCKVKKLIFADADVVFLQNPIGPLDEELGTNDIVLQRDSSGIQFIDSLAYHLFDYICGGFIYMKVNDNTKLLYQSILQFQKNQSWNDQAGLNVCIRHYSLNVTWNLLSVPRFPNGKVFFDFGSDPTKAVIVHANFKSGSMEKIAHMIIHNIWCYEEIVGQLCKEIITTGCTKDANEPERSWCVDFKNLCLTQFLDTIK